MENEFPANSHARRETRAPRQGEKPTERPVPARITKSKAIQRKKPLRKKFLEAFRPEDNVGFVEYTVLEVLVPGIKDALADAVHGTIDNALGSGGSARRRRSGGGGYTSYNRMGSGRPRDRRDRDDDRRSSRRDISRASDHAEIVLDSRVEAEETLDGMYELLSKYDAVTRRDFLSMVGEPTTPIDEDWGWTELRGARVHRVREGYLIDLPRPEPLD